MDDFSVYKMYIALKLHFTTDNYDITKRNGKVKASRQAFEKRKDLFSIKKIAKTYSDEEVAHFLVSNFVSGNRWGGIFDADAGKTYLEWKGKMESLSYIFNNELDNLILELEEQNLSLEDSFKITKAHHPYILRAYLRKTISLETLTIIEKIFPFVEYFDSKLSADLVWPDVSRLIKKYKPFIRIDKERYNDIFGRRYGTGSKCAKD
jgi:hypothetical protein